MTNYLIALGVVVILGIVLILINYGGSSGDDDTSDPTLHGNWEP